MNGHANREDWLHRSLRAALDTAPPPESPHPVDQVDLLLDWCEGALSPDALAELHGHLARCPACRREVAAMIRAGALPLPGLADEASEEARSATDQQVRPHPATSPSSISPSPSSRGWLRLALAASVLIALGGLSWLLTAPGAGAQLAYAERLLSEGRAREAFERIETLWDRGLSDRDRRRAARLLVQAGDASARADLARADFAAVLETEERVARRTGRMAELVNARLQAQRGVPAACGLQQAGSLIDYGYELDGSSPGKSMPILDDTTERLEAEFQEALAEFPDDVPLLLNRGQFLLEVARYEEAQASFARAQELAVDNPAARLGRGLAAFELGRAEEALQHFEAAKQLDPREIQADLNAGIALRALGRDEEARARFQQVREQTPDASLQARIDAELAR